MQPQLPRYSCNVLTESSSQYRSGLYYPVKLGDTFKNGRYKIWHKLGWGGFSTIWLARDLMYVYFFYHIDCTESGRTAQTEM